jgi:hypothetical protein
VTQFRQIAGGADDGDGWATTSVEKKLDVLCGHLRMFARGWLSFPSADRLRVRIGSCWKMIYGEIVLSIIFLK